MPNGQRELSTRPTTARPQTAASTRRIDANFVISIMESRGVNREVGIAALDQDTNKVTLIQVRSNRSAIIQYF